MPASRAYQNVALLAGIFFWYTLLVYDKLILGMPLRVGLCVSSPRFAVGFPLLSLMQKETIRSSNTHSPPPHSCILISFRNKMARKSFSKIAVLHSTWKNFEVLSWGAYELGTYYSNKAHYKITYESKFKNKNL